MSWETVLGVALGATVGPMVAYWITGRHYGTPRAPRPYKPRNRRRALRLIRAATKTALSITTAHELVAALWDQQHLVGTIPSRERFDLWHGRMVLTVIERRGYHLVRANRRMAR